MTFITKSTKVNCIIATSIISVLLLILIMMSTLMMVSSDTKLLISFIYTSSIVIITLFWQGIIQLKVFGNYKCQNKLLCADGVISIAMSVLLLASGILFGVLQLNSVLSGGEISNSDMRIFLMAYMCVLALWKIAMFIMGVIKKQFNKWYELVIALMWFALATICCISMFVNNFNVFAWLAISFGWVLVVMYLTNLIHTYTIANPKFLETEEAYNIYNEQQESLKQEETQIKEEIGRYSPKGSKVNIVANKIRKLRELKELGLISDDEYKKKKENILDNL